MDEEENRKDIEKIMNNPGGGFDIKSFMLTYGWAILIVVIAVAAIAYFGGLNDDVIIDETNTTTTTTLPKLFDFGTTTTTSTSTTLEYKSCVTRRVYDLHGNYTEYCSDLITTDDTDDGGYVCSSVNQNLKCPSGFSCKLTGKNGICIVNKSNA